jgi:hypothetical protein
VEGDATVAARADDNGDGDELADFFAEQGAVGIRGRQGLLALERIRSAFGRFRNGLGEFGLVIFPIEKQGAPPRRCVNAEREYSQQRKFEESGDVKKQPDAAVNNSKTTPTYKQRYRCEVVGKALPSDAEVQFSASSMVTLKENSWIENNLPLPYRDNEFRTYRWLGLRAKLSLGMSGASS